MITNPQRLCPINEPANGLVLLKSLQRVGHKKALLSKRKEARLAKVEQKVSLALDMNFELRPCGSSTCFKSMTVIRPCVDGLSEV